MGRKQTRQGFLFLFYHNPVKIFHLQYFGDDWGKRGRRGEEEGERGEKKGRGRLFSRERNKGEKGGEGGGREIGGKNLETSLIL